MYVCAEGLFKNDSLLWGTHDNSSYNYKLIR